MPVINYIGKNMKTFNVSAHQHNYWEIIYCTNGNGVIETDSQKVEYSKNQVVVIPPNTIHSNYSQNGFRNIHLTVANWTPTFKNVVLVDDNSNNDLLTVLNMCFRYFNANAAEQSDIIISFSELVLSMLNNFGGANHASQQVEAIANAIVENFSDPEFELEDVYSKFDLTKDYLRRQFIKEKGISPLQFLKNTRINFAQKLLLSKNINNYKIFEVAEMCGFTDQLYFSRVFRQITGVSPKEFTESPKLDHYNAE
jgi:AraC family transcriptional regulator, L-rhamnose operon regulatory protein RhaS